MLFIASAWILQGSWEQSLILKALSVQVVEMGAHLCTGRHVSGLVLIVAKPDQMSIFEAYMCGTCSCWYTCTSATNLPEKHAIAAVLIADPTHMCTPGREMPTCSPANLGMLCHLSLMQKLRLDYQAGYTVDLCHHGYEAHEMRLEE